MVALEPENVWETVTWAGVEDAGCLMVWRAWICPSQHIWEHIYLCKCKAHSEAVEAWWDSSITSMHISMHNLHSMAYGTWLYKYHWTKGTVRCHALMPPVSDATWCLIDLAWSLFLCVKQSFPSASLMLMWLKTEKNGSFFFHGCCLHQFAKTGLKQRAVTEFKTYYCYMRQSCCFQLMLKRDCRRWTNGIAIRNGRFDLIIVQ